MADDAFKRGKKSRRGRLSGARPVGSAFQPGSEEDLRRFPPGSGECRRIRALLRDYSDGDLAGFLRGEVDEHVYGCRECGLALSRSELESLRLRKAYAEEQEQLAAPDDLTNTILERVQDLDLGARIFPGVSASLSDPTLAAGDDEAGLEGDSEDGDQAPLPDDFTSKVMDRVRMEWRPQFVHERVINFTRKSVFLLPLAALLLLGLLFWSAVLTRPESEPVFRMGSFAEATIELPKDALDGATIGQSGELSSGSQLPRGSTITVGEVGAASLRLEDPAGAVLLRAQLEADSRLSLVDDLLFLAQGAMQVEGACQVQLADLAGIRLFESGDGKAVRAHLSIMAVQRVDQALAVASPLRVRVAVDAGIAEITRGDRVEMLLPAGRSAEFDRSSGIAVDLALTSELLTRSRQSAQRPNRDPLTQASASWHGNLRSSLTGEGLLGIEVELRSQAGEMTLRTAADGSFMVPEGFLRGSLAVVRVRWQDGLGAYASYGPEPLDLSRLQVGRLPAIELAEDRPIAGTVSSSQFGPLASARVYPALVDDVFQLFEPIEECAVISDSNGRFVLHGLPQNLDTQQRLVLLAEHEGHVTRAFLDITKLQGSSRSNVQLLLEAGSKRRLHGLEPGQSVELWESVPGLPPRALGEAREVIADSQGVVELNSAGDGPFWYANMQRGVLVELSSDPDGQSLEIPYVPGPARGHRYDWLGAAPSFQFSDTARYRVMVQGDPQAPSVSGSRIFMRESLGRTRFLGTYDGFTDVEFAVMEGRDFDLFAFDPSGGLGSIPSGFLPSSDATIAIKVEASEDIALSRESSDEIKAGGSGLRRGEADSILVRAYRQDAVLPGSPFWRLLGAENSWALQGLPAGSYRVFRVDGREVTGLEIGK